MSIKPSASGQWEKGFFPPQIKERPRLHSPILPCFPVSGAGSLLDQLSVGCCCTLARAGFPQGASTEFQNSSSTLSLCQCHTWAPSLRSSSLSSSSSFGGREKPSPAGWCWPCPSLSVSVCLQQHRPFWAGGQSAVPAALVPFPHPSAAPAPGSAGFPAAGAPGSRDVRGHIQVEILPWSTGEPLGDRGATERRSL